MNILMVELTNVCNEDCWFCPHSKMKREQGFMSMETVKLAIEKMKAAMKSKEMKEKGVVLNNTGESLLHPQFFEIADMFKYFFTTITTNASCLNRELVKGLIESKLDLIRISIDFDFDEVLLRELMHKNKNVQLNFKGTTREQVVKLREEWPGVEAVSLTNWADQMPNNNEVESNICPFKNNNAGVLLWDGRVTPCCFDYEGDRVLGTLEEVENLKFKKIDLCEKCGGLY